MSAPNKPSPFYKKKYGSWAGNPDGFAPNYKLCCEQVWSKERFSRGYQCNRPRGHGPDLAYCKQHDPVAVEARRAAARTRSNAKWNARRLEIHGPTFFEALVKIANGHNDPITLARQIIEKFKKGAS